MATTTTSFGELLRTWRDRRRLTQQDLSLRADVSTRHLSFLENGHAEPSREMVLALAEQLEIPLRERNHLLGAAGYAAVYDETPLNAPDMTPVRDAVDLVLRGHEPYPAIAVDRCWDIVAMNAAASLFATDVAPQAVEPRPNSYRLSLHPDGLAPRIVNFAQVAHHLLHRLRHDVAVSADADLAALLDEVERYPTVREIGRPVVPDSTVVVPVRLRTPLGQLSLFTTVATFGTPVDVTVAELALETFFPADEATAQRLQSMADARGGS